MDGPENLVSCKILLNGVFRFQFPKRVSCGKPECNFEMPLSPEHLRLMPASNWSGSFAVTSLATTHGTRQTQNALAPLFVPYFKLYDLSEHLFLHGSNFSAVYKIVQADCREMQATMGGLRYATRTALLDSDTESEISIGLDGLGVDNFRMLHLKFLRTNAMIRLNNPSAFYFFGFRNFEVLFLDFFFVQGILKFVLFCLQQ